MEGRRGGESCLRGLHSVTAESFFSLPLLDSFSTITFKQIQKLPMRK